MSQGTQYKYTELHLLSDASNSRITILAHEKPEPTECTDEEYEKWLDGQVELDFVDNDHENFVLCHELKNYDDDMLRLITDLLSQGVVTNCVTIKNSKAYFSK